jgi:hypothetical protein
MHDEPWDREVRGGLLDVERGDVPLDVVEHIEVLRQDLPGAHVFHLLHPGCPPGGALGRLPSLDGGDRRPGDERANARIARGMQHRHASAARVPEQPDGAWRDDTKLAGRQRIDYPTDVMPLGGEGVVPEAFGEHELAAVIHSAPAQVECGHADARAGETLRERWPHPPVLESLEAVHDHDHRAGRPPAAGTHVDEDVTQIAGEPVPGEGWGGHAPS